MIFYYLSLLALQFVTFFANLLPDPPAWFYSVVETLVSSYSVMYNTASFLPFIQPLLEVFGFVLISISAGVSFRISMYFVRLITGRG